jgi:hypothetical protein
MSASSQPPSLPIAQVRTPQGAIWYIAQAREHQGFVVQRRHRNAEEGDDNALRAPEFQFLAAYYRPFLNPGAVQAAGLSAQAIQRWADEHPGKIFTHPTYAHLCLRWDGNAHGYEVTALAEEPVEPADVPFTPHTCWRTGTTYYQLAVPEPTYLPIPEEDALLLAQLRDQAGLVRHEREVGEEGPWRGWYTTDRVALEQTLASLERRLVLAQPSFHYGVWLQMTPRDSGDDARQPVALYTSMAEAYRHFAALQESSGSTDRGGFPRLTHGHVVEWPGQEPQWQPVASLCLPEGLAFSALEQARHLVEPIRYSPGREIAFNGHLAEPEQALLQIPPTLAKVLASTGLSRPQLATALGWTLAEVNLRIQDPACLTMGELEQVARLVQQPVSELATNLSWEIQWQAKQAQVVAQANAQQASWLSLLDDL